MPPSSGTTTPRAAWRSPAPTTKLAQVAPPTAANIPLGARTATTAGFVVRTSPNASSAAASLAARAKAEISGASPVVAGVRHRTHRIPAARLAHQLEAAGATAAANRLTLAGDAAGVCVKSSMDTACSSSTEAGLRPSMLASTTTAADGPGATASDMDTDDGMDTEKPTNVAGGAGASTANVSLSGIAVGCVPAGSSATTAAVPSTPTPGWVKVISVADLSDAGSAVPSTSRAPSLVGSAGGVSTPGQRDIESGPPSPSQPLTWRSTRRIPPPIVQIPLSKTPPAPSNATAEAGQLATRESQVVEAAVRASTASLRADLAAMCARTKDTAARLQHLFSKVDTSVNLSQQTLVAMRKVEAAVKEAISDVAKKGAAPDKEDGETAEQQAEKLLEDGKVR
eukprot:TRINITY_DN1709_c0_g1_i13.p1 TRINITY_DN1709_c0_g1~~TRINITY_DN1709_c0_g1_i13.p1  ORF type:complete len:397 (+),score=51.97 TRINITY_DN1709_c0_g1_i13:466-1656(+)